MVKGYIFKIENDELICIKVVNNTTATYYGEEAIDWLKFKDRVKYKKVRITQTGIVFESPNSRVYITNDVITSNKNYLNCMYNNIDKLTNAIKKYNKKYGKQSVVKSSKKGTAVLGILAMLAVAKTTGSLVDDSILAEAKVERFEEIENANTYEEINTSVEQNNIDEQKDNTFEKQLKSISEKLVEDQKDIVENIQKPFSPQELLTDLDKDSTVINMSYNDNFDEVKFRHTKDNYYDNIIERATRWGISTNLMLSLGAQESGGYDPNLMQVQFNSWHDQPITLYNFEKEKYETIILTNTPEKYANKRNVQLISEEELLNPKTNISVACIILRYSFEQMDHNMIAAIQAYNFGVSNMKAVLRETAKNENCSVADLLSNQNNTEFLKYRNIIEVGDSEYVEHVFRFLQDSSEPISIRYIDEQGEEQETSIIVNNEKSTRTL